MHRPVLVAAAVAALVPSVALAAPPTKPSHATTPPPQAKAYGRHCLDAAPASLRRGTPEFRTYLAACLAAAKQADRNATTGEDTAAAIVARGKSACAHQAAFAPPRSKPSLRIAFAACIRAAVAAQKDD